MIESAELILLIDQLEQGVLLVTGRAVVLHLNRMAEALLRSGVLRRDAAGAVACPVPEDTRRLRRSVGEVAAGAAGDERRLVIHRLEGSHPLSMRVVGVHAGGGPDHPAAAVLVSDPERLAAPAEAHLRELYGLTPAEARVAAAVLDTEPLQHIADRLAVSVNAIRIHLQHVFDKTGTHRQAELVRLLMAHRLPAVDDRRLTMAPASAATASSRPPRHSAGAGPRWCADAVARLAVAVCWWVTSAAVVELL
jgi:DNA-binding CsgD family transcriptional regulator